MLAMCGARLQQPGKAVDMLRHSSRGSQFDERGLATGGPFPYFPANGGLLCAVAMMAAGWDGAPQCPRFSRRRQLDRSLGGAEAGPATLNAGEQALGDAGTDRAAQGRKCPVRGARSPAASARVRRGCPLGGWRNSTFGADIGYVACIRRRSRRRSWGLPFAVSASTV